MFQLKNTIVSEDILSSEFVCNLSACKGACCVEGEAGAPLEPSEAKKLELIFENLKPYLRKEGIAAIDSQGTHITIESGELETPLVKGRECAYAVFDASGKAGCGIEKAYLEGAVDFRKPISCHLYPVRVKEYSEFSAVNYHRWPICESACSLGKELSVPVYKFVKEALIRKFGPEWYSELEIVASKLND